MYCAPHDCSQPGQLEIYEEVNKTYQKPKKVISLTEINQPGVQSGSPCTSLSSSPGNPGAYATSPSTNGSAYWPFQIVLRTGEVFEFFAELPEDQRQWVKRLGLLLMFPYSPIPEEPVNSPIKDSFRARLDPAQYCAGEFTVLLTCYQFRFSYYKQNCGRCVVVFKSCRLLISVYCFIYFFLNGRVSRCVYCLLSA